MPDDRMLHPRQSQSEKVSGLDDLTYRVWIATLLHADDWGVLPYSAAHLRGQVFALQRREEKEILACLAKICEVALLVLFEHQGREWVVHPAWAEHQKIRFPRRTYFPCPPAEILPKLLRNTSAMFRKRLGTSHAKTSLAVSRKPLAVSRKPLAVSRKPLAVSESAAARGKGAISEDAFVAALRSQYPTLDVDRELKAMDDWLARHPGRKKTRRFVENWLSRCDLPLASANGSGPPADPLDALPVLHGYYFNDCPMGARGFCVKTKHLPDVPGATPERDQCEEHRGK